MLVYIIAGIKKSLLITALQIYLAIIHLVLVYHCGF